MTSTLSSKSVACRYFVLSLLFAVSNGFAVSFPQVQTLSTSSFIALASTQDNNDADFSVLEDDGDDDSKRSSRGYVPEDFTVVDDDSGESDQGERSQYIRTDFAMERDFDTEEYRGESFPSSVAPYEQSSFAKPSRGKDVRMSTDGASWMQRNSAFSNSADQTDNTRKFSAPNRERSRSDGDWKSSSRTFRQDFRGTRVFVQNLPPNATWQDLKDHFRIAGEVIFASVSADRETGKSKGCGVVQFETTEMAMNAIATMRNHPMQGIQLYVREDVQEVKVGAELGMPKPKRGPTPPSMWKCANEENTSYLSVDETQAICALIKARDDARRRRQFDAADIMRDELKMQYNVHIDDRLKLWWTAVDGNQVPQSVRDIKGEGRWGEQRAWRQVLTTPENDACVNPDLVNGLLQQRDIARREKDFTTADSLLEEARTSADNNLSLRIHDESRTWRIWTDEPPPRQVVHRKSPAEECMEILREHAPDKVEEMQVLLDKFPGREYNILKKLQQRYR
jgi:hypothetical protein